jgi:kojibiose phosphorylase
MRSSFEQRQWQVKEYPFHAHDLPHTETIFTLGNGLVGVRGSFEEGYPNDSALTLVAGVFDHKPGTLVPELVAMPNWLALEISVDGERYHLSDGKILGFSRILHLDRALLERGVLWRSPNGVLLRLAFERFTSLANQHVLALQVLLQVLSEGQHQLRVTSRLDGAAALNDDGVDHWGSLAGQAQGEFVTLTGHTETSGYHMAMASHLSIEGATGRIIQRTEGRSPSLTMEFEAAQNQKVTVTKLVSLHTSRDSNDPASSASATLQAALKQGYSTLQAAHEAAWADYWADFDIQIEGDEIAQRAVRFCTYHTLIATPTQDERVSIAAKTLSGHGYKGHVFWDTELFILPPLTLVRPDLAKRLLMYRYHNLAGARHKAIEGGYRGAMFPWESTDTGEETTPRWVTTGLGERIRIWTGDNEQHISTDIAYAVLQFWRWTGDDDWFARYGAELVLDTALFWGSRAEYNAEQQRYELRQQIGPDEYHENVDNSAFTNRMVVWHLQQAVQTWRWLQTHHLQQALALAETLSLNPNDIALWERIAQEMWIPMQDGVLEQFEGFFERLKPINMEDYTPRTINMDVILGHAKTQVKRVIKQADIVMLMYLLQHDLGDDAFLRRNWEVYKDVVDHGSSLSPSIHAIVAARLGMAEEAYDLFLYSATIDLDDHKGNVRDGIHAAACGGTWQAVILGFCGVEISERGITCQPNFPAHWRKVSFTLTHRGQKQHFALTNPKG